MAIAAGGLSLVESDRLAFLRQENKASWRKVSLHPLSPARSPWMAAATSRVHSVLKRRCGSPGSVQLRTCLTDSSDSCRATLMLAV